MRYISRLSFVLLSALLASVATADDLTTGAGKKLTGTLVAVDKDGVTFKLGDERNGCRCFLIGTKCQFIDSIDGL